MTLAVRIASLSALFGLALAVRVIDWPSVLTDDGVLFVDGDAYYHMWRIWHAVTHFPSVLAEDGFINFPHGGEVPWPPGFDWSVAALIRSVVGSTDPARAELLGAWLPPLLGAATVVVVARIGARHFSWSGGIAAGFLLAVLPGGAAYTRLGFLDHHCAVALIGTLLLGGTMRVVADPGVGPGRWPVRIAVAVSAALLTWAGALLHIVVAQAALVVWMLCAREGAIARSRAARLAAAQAMIAVVLLPFCYGRSWGDYGSFTPLALSNFQPTWFAAGALCLAALAVAWRAPAVGSTRARRCSSAIAAGAVGFALAFVLVADLRDILARSAAWFGGEEVFHERIAELRPYLGQAGSWNLDLATAQLSYLFVALPLAAGTLLLGGGLRRPERWLLLAWTAAFGAALLTQYRFINTFAMAFCLVWGGAIATSIELARARGLSLAWSTGALAAAVGLALTPTWSLHRPLVDLWRGSPELSARTQRALSFRDAARWIQRRHPTSLDETGPPEFGVLCAWGLGHQTRYYSQMPMVQDNFGPYAAPENVLRATRYFAAIDEAEALSILEELRVRYVIVDRYGTGRPDPYEPESLTLRMVERRGSLERTLRSPSAPDSPLPALSGHRLVYETGRAQAPVQVWQRVRAARVSGRALPGARVSAGLTVTAGSRRFRYTAETKTDQTGRYELSLPYATATEGAGEEDRRDRRDRRTGLDYEIRSRGEQARLAVSETAVVSGTTVVGPSFD